MALDGVSLMEHNDRAAESEEQDQTNSCIFSKAKCKQKIIRHGRIYYYC